MPTTPEYCFKRADEVEAAGTKTTDPILKRAFEELAQALRVMGDRLRASSPSNLAEASDAEIERLAERMTDPPAKL